MTQETRRLDGDSRVAVTPATPARALSAQSPVKPAATSPAAPATTAPRLDPDSHAALS